MSVQREKNVGEETFDNAKAFTRDGYAAVEKNGKWGFVDAEGNLVIDCQYDDALSFTSGYAAVKQGDVWGYIDTETQWRSNRILRWLQHCLQREPRLSKWSMKTVKSGS